MINHGSPKLRRVISHACTVQLFMDLTDELAIQLRDQAASVICSTTYIVIEMLVRTRVGCQLFYICMYSSVRRPAPSSAQRWGGDYGPNNIRLAHPSTRAFDRKSQPGQDQRQSTLHNAHCTVCSTRASTLLLPSTVNQIMNLDQISTSTIKLPFIIDRAADPFFYVFIQS